eukprot:m.39940 g.39940  ORF g.39940 m.39940 type:complete len:374 (+) comp9611_c0_seq1:177-1298(+)
MEEGWSEAHVLGYSITHALHLLQSGKLKVENDEGEPVSLDAVNASTIATLARAAADRVTEADMSHMVDPMAIGGVKLFEASQVKEEVKKVLVQVILEKEKNGELSRNKGSYKVDTYSAKGRRQHMEDRHTVIEDLNTLLKLEGVPQQAFFGVFDGHGGVEAADFAAAQTHMFVADHEQFQEDAKASMKAGFEATDKSFLEKAEREALTCGATACSILIRGNKLHVAWLGDSQAMMCKDDKAVNLMNPHKPEREDEKKRIEDDGGVVVWYGAWRVNGMLSVARAIGDKKLKKWVIGSPDVEEFDLDGTEDYLVLGCDGLFDIMKYDKIVEFISKFRQEHNGEVKGVAEALCTHCVEELNCMDNVTVVVVFFNKD